MKVPKAVKVTGWVLFVVSLFFVFFLLFGEDIKTQRQLNDQLSRQLEENAKLQEELNEIQEKLAKLEDPEYLEYLARQQGLVFSDEKVIIYREEEKK